MTSAGPGAQAGKGPPAGTPEALVLVTGHEAREADGLLPLAQTLTAEGLAAEVVVCPGRALHHRVRELLLRRDLVAVLPMTWGRDPVLVADTAKALQWLTATTAAGRAVLCQNLGTPDHLVAHLRRAVREAAGRPGAGVLLTAASQNPFDDAELHRLAHLVRTHGAGVEVEVACLRAGLEAADLDRAVDRCRRLGMEEVVVVPADLARSSPAELRPGDTADAGRWQDVRFFGPLVSDSSLVGTVAARLTEARHGLAHGDDGIAAGLGADHGHGYAHSHAVEGAEHAHGRSHGHPHAHGGPDVAGHPGAHDDDKEPGRNPEGRNHPPGLGEGPRRNTGTTTAAREPSEV